MSRAFKRGVFGLSVVLVGLAVLGSFGPGGVSAGSQADGAYPEIEVYSEVLKKIQTDYVVEPDVNRVTTGALHGLLESLDSDSSYLSPEEYKSYKQHEKEASGQVGLNMSKRYGYATVVSVLPGSPAAKQQIQDGDIIEALEGHSTREMSLAMIRLLLRGQPGTNVTFSLIRPRQAEPEKVTLTRTAPEVPPLGEQQYENSSILYLKPSVLTKERVDQIESRIKAMRKNGNKKICLDLRDVARGDEAQGVRLANFFLQSGTIATLSGQKFPTEVFSADPSVFLTSAPLAVLVNRGTAGAAEIVAAAILDDKRGDVVGDRTFGEGSVQKTIELPDGGAVILSVAKYASPLGRKIQDDAVIPDVIVASEDDLEEEVTAGEKIQHQDQQLDKALEILKQKNA